MGRRKGLKFLGVIIAILVVVVVAIWLSINYVAGYLIEKYGSQVTGTQITVSGVDISAFRGEASINSLKVGNPKGFTYPDILTLDNISIVVDTSTIKSDTVVIKSLIIDAPHLYYEQNDDNQSNLSVLQSNIENNTASTEDDQSDQNESQTNQTDSQTDEASKKKVVIKNLIINDIAVNAKIPALANKELTFSIDEIQMTDVGQSGTGETTGQIIQQVLKVIATKAVSAFAQAELKEGINSTTDQIKDSLNSLKCKLSPSSCQ
ncbi:MAG: hypothetical protein EP298_00350 [Gammaproteobacteria bacterium]|nr:MAG: hypothetical protein EP298_00350 [Gammaproteobacteria bacterium]UTW42035.1 hypothetical protein KFE69_11070 [bacterium SCSIO 12844]